MHHTRYAGPHNQQLAKPALDTSSAGSSSRRSSLLSEEPSSQTLYQDSASLAEPQLVSEVELHPCSSPRWRMQHHCQDIVGQDEAHTQAALAAEDRVHQATELAPRQAQACTSRCARFVSPTSSMTSPGLFIPAVNGLSAAPQPEMALQRELRLNPRGKDLESSGSAQFPACSVRRLQEGRALAASAGSAPCIRLAWAELGARSVG